MRPTLHASADDRHLMTSARAFALARCMRVATKRLTSALAVPGIVAFIAVAATGAPSPAAADTCPNAAYRTGASSKLPDCRAYELVSPGADKQGNALDLAQTYIADDGNRISLKIFNSLQDGSTGWGNYVATRGPSGWETHSISNVPAPDPTSSSGNFNVNLDGTSSDLSQLFLNSAGGPATNDPVYGAWRASPDGNLSLLAATPPGGDLQAVGSSPDGTHVVLSTFDGALGPVPGGPMNASADLLYEHFDGNLRLVNVDDSGNVMNRNGARFPSSTRYGGTSGAFHAVSKDGSRIFFLSLEPGGVTSDPVQLYARVNGQKTIEVSASQHTAPQPALATASFSGASADGTKAFFTTTGQLTDDATGSGPFLYMFDLPAGGSAGTLTLVAGTQHPVSGSQVLPSDDGSHIYYLSPDDGGSLFVYHATGPEAGQSRLIAQGLGDVGVNRDTRLVNPIVGSNANFIPGELTPDGSHLLFTSDRSLTAGDANTGAQLYKYDDAVGSGSLTLISTGPAAPQSMFNSMLLQGNFQANGLFGDDYYPSDGMLVEDTTSAAIANPAAIGFGSWYHNLSDDGRSVFFETGVPLVPDDVNGKVDVYRWHDGAVALISQGTGPYNSYFAGAAADGSTVIFATRDALLSGDGDGQMDYYAARVGGGFAPLAQPATCSGDACQAQGSSPPGAPSIGTITFEGPGNMPIVSTPSAKGVRKASVSARKSVKGSSFTLRVKVPAKGRIKASGSGLKSVSKAAAKAATYDLKVGLTARAKRSLERRHKLRVRVRVLYAPTAGASSTTTVSVTLKA